MSDVRRELKNEWQELHLALDKARQEVTSLDKKLCHARKNLEEEKHKRRMAEQQRDLLESQINMIQEILFHDEKVNFDEDTKRKLQFLSKPVIKTKQNSNIRDLQNEGLNTIMEMDSTGSILSDLNCLSKSEDDVDINSIFMEAQRKEWKDYKPKCQHSINNQHSTLDKVAEFNSLDRPISVKSNINSTYTVPFQAQIVPSNGNVDSKISDAKVYANHSLISKMVIKPETCTLCSKRIRFGKVILKCKDCSIMCHAECKAAIQHPCLHEEITTS